MILNARQNLFDFRFPRGFFFPEIEDRYKAYIRALPLPFDNVSDYMNHCIQSFRLPTISTQPDAEQTLSARNTKWRGRHPLHLYTNQEFQVTFKLTEGYISYMIMFDQMRTFYEFSNEIEFLPSCKLRMLDYGGRAYMSIKFEQVLLTGLTSVDLSYTSAIPQLMSFTCDFKFNIFEIQKELQ